jgi:hypothetical protein
MSKGNNADSPFCCINDRALPDTTPVVNRSPKTPTHTPAAAAAAAAVNASLAAGLEHKPPATKGQRGKPKAVRGAAASGPAAAVTAGNTGAARATCTRRATEKGAALQETQLVKRGRGRPRKQAAEVRLESLAKQACSM